MVKPQQPKQQVDHLALVGALDVASVPALTKQCERFIKQAPDSELALDLNKVQRADSAGVALLLECQRLARLNNKTLQIIDAPQQLLAIATVSGVEQMLVGQ